MEWILPLIQMIIEMIGGCTKRDGREAVKRRLLSPGFAARLGLYRLARKAGKRGRELREAVAEGMEYLRAASPAEIDDFLDEVTEGDAA